MDDFTERIQRAKSDLDDNGWAVVEGILTSEECDTYRQQYDKWLANLISCSSFDWPPNMHSVIQGFRIGHLEPSWNIRLKAKKVYSGLWNTTKLLTSIDGTAIGRPPEEGATEFASNDNSDHWLHIDQAPNRKGLHGYQGAVYLEEACEDDWVLQVINGSHEFHQEVFGKFCPQADGSYHSNEFSHYVSDEQVKWYECNNCHVMRIPVPKGGVILWDSRTVHANAKPKRNRQHPGRWRYVSFICMGPAQWASDKDIELKKKAYDEMLMTCHWPSQGVVLFPDKPSPGTIETLPDIASHEEVKQLCGVLPYDFDDGTSNGSSPPVYK